MRRIAAILAIAGSACADRIQRIDPPWPSDQAVVLIQLPDGEAPTVDVFPPAARIEIPVLDDRPTQLIVQTYDGNLAPYEDLVQCGVTFGSSHPLPLPVRGIWASPAVDLGSGEVVFTETQADAIPKLELSYTSCLSDDVDCAALVPEVIESPAVDANIVSMALLDDDLLFYALDVEDQALPPFRLFRYEHLTREHRLIDPPPGVGNNIEALAFFEGELVVTTTVGAAFYYSPSGDFLRAGESLPFRRGLAAADHVLVRYGASGLRTEPPDRIGPLDQHIFELALVSADRAAAVTSAGLQVWEGGRWYDRSNVGRIGNDNNWHIGMDESVIVAVSESGDIAVRVEPDVELTNLGRPFGVASNVRGAVGLGAGRWLVTAEDGQIRVQHRGGVCAVDVGIANNLRRPYRLPMGRTVWLGASDLNAVPQDPAYLIRIPLPFRE